MSKKEEAVEQLKNCEDMHIWVKPIKDYINELEAKEERAKKEHELLGLYQQIETDIPTKMLKRIRELEEELK